MKTVRALKACLPVFIGLAFFVLDARAAIDSAGVFDDVLARYHAAASAWASVITSRASWLFWTLVVISMVWTFGMMALRKADIGEFFAEFIRFTVFTGFFWWLLTNGPNFASSIYSSLRQMAGNASGLGSSLTPSSIVDVGFDIYYRVMDQSSVWSPVDSMAGMLIAVVILVVLALVGVNMLLLLTSGWILAYAGVFFLGFGGSRWTSDMAINYYKTVLGVAAQLMTMVLLVGIGKTFLDGYYIHMSAGINLKEMGVMLVVVIILLALVNKVPGLISGIINGASIGNAGIGNFGAGVAVGAAGMAAAAAATGRAMIASGATSAAGGAQAVMAAFSKASENVQSGSDMLTNMWGGGERATGASEIGTGNTPFAHAAGFGSSAGVLGESKNATSRAGGDAGLISSVAQAAGNVGKVVADAGANLARGAFEVAQNKASSLKDASTDRIADTTGGRIAAAIKGQGSNDPPTFTANSLSGDQQADRESEVASFANRDRYSTLP